MRSLRLSAVPSPRPQARYARVGLSSISTLAALVLLSVGCSGAPDAKAPELPVVAKAAEPENDAATAEAEPPAPEIPRTLPESCTEEGDPCLPPTEFAERLCDGVYPEVALKLFAKDTPWKRVYVRGNMQAWHVGRRSEPRQLWSGEEVIIVKQSGSASGGMSIGGGAAFDVVRWDGSCVSLMEDELSFHRNPAARPAVISWSRLDPSYRTALSEDSLVATLRKQQKAVCDQGSKEKCQLAEHRLSMGIAKFVREGNELPRPPFIP